MISDQDELQHLQDNIRIVAPSLPALEDFSEGTECIVKYSVDEQWYRAVIIDSDSKITSIQFIDYGNTDIITDNNLIRSMYESFSPMKRYAMPCAMPVDFTAGTEWSDTACELLRALLPEEITFELLSAGERCNLVNIYFGERDIMHELIKEKLATALPFIQSAQNVYISHINSLSDFYIQMEKDTKVL